MEFLWGYGLFGVLFLGGALAYWVVSVPLRM